MPQRASLALWAVAVLALLTARATAQCETWLSVGANPTFGTQTMIGWDLDGPGPLPEQVLVNGGPNSTSQLDPNYVARVWDGQRWAPVGSQLPFWTDGVTAFLRWRDELYAFGDLHRTVGGPLNGITRWNGADWVAAAGGAPLNINCAAVYNGDLVVAGKIESWNPFGGVARWDGAQWRPFGAGMAGLRINALAHYQGELIAAGKFTFADGQPVTNIARWDGQAWRPLGTGVTAIDVYALAEYRGELYAAGDTVLSGNDNIARWDGQTWRPVGGGVRVGSPGIKTMLVHDDRLLIGGKLLSVSAAAVAGVAVWDGTSWTTRSVGDDNRTIKSLQIINGVLHAAGDFYTRAGSGAGVARWDGERWRPMGPGFVGYSIHVFAQLDDHLVISGNFAAVDDTEYLDEVVWNGSTWSPWTAGPAGSFPAFAPYRGGLAWGDYGGVKVWNGGVGSTPLGETNNNVYALAGLGEGLVAAGSFTRIAGLPVSRVARWNGAAWNEMGGMNDSVVALLNTADGMVAAGLFTLADGFEVNRIARWDGQRWLAMGAGFNGIVRDLVEFRGDLFAAGQFTASGGTPVAFIARWDGSSWLPLSEGLNDRALALAVYNDELFVGGEFTRAGGAVARGIAAWNGVSWREPAGGVDGPVFALEVFNNRLIVGGAFEYAGGVASNLMAQLASCPPACPADLDGDGVVDFTDYLAFLNAFDTQDPAADLDRDGVVDFTDYLLFLTAYDTGC